jgi:hypothetical protein
MNTINNQELANITNQIETKIGEFVTLHTRPIYTDDNKNLPDISGGMDKTAFVLQGPVSEQFDFTFETVKLYRRIFPEVIVIISTWQDESDEILNKIESLGAVVIRSIKPGNVGIGNVNLQIRSSQSGIRRALSLNAKYVLKTRTDVRIHAPDFLIHAQDLTLQFPLPEDVQKLQTKRLISISSGNKYLINFVPDLNMYGHIDDMIKYWSPLEDERTEATGLSSIVDLAKFGISESYFFREYFKQINIECKYNLEDYWLLLRNHFVVMDAISADIYWMRHNRYREFKNIHYLGLNTYDNFGFKDWLRLYSGTFPIMFNNKIIEKQPGEFI